MKSLTLLRACVGLIALCGAAVTMAQSQTSCVTAGRINDAGQWAPQLEGLRFLDAEGKVLRGTPEDILKKLKQISVSKPLPLSACQASVSPLPELKEAPGAKREKSQHLTASTKLVEVSAVHRPGLRSGGSLVELQVLAPATRIAMR
jgi:hypothetical protein